MPARRSILAAALPSTRPADTGHRPADTRHRPAAATASAALALLDAGNRRYAADHPRHPHAGPGRRRALAVSQQPFACVLGCIDSRVPPELVFDQGLGDLLTVRTAGCVLDEAVLASIQFGVAELRVPLVLVLGHERCGAVSSVVEAMASGRPLPGHLAYVQRALTPAVRSASRRGGDWVDNAVGESVVRARRRLVAEPGLGGAVRVAAGRFDLDTGRVRMLR
ncbi:carbonic anhydrase [Streptomyces boninensis]|uniref:carbonic anhydrase n=1 Tax=Streptomyces boninensis TaxID=2039455 RepID=UPI003B21275D